MLDNPDIQKLMKCGEQMRDMMPQMPFMDQANDDAGSVTHVCDQ